MNSFDSEEASEEGSILEDSREHFEASKDSNRSSEKQPTRRKADESEVQFKTKNAPNHGKYIYLNKKANKYVVTIPKAFTIDGKPKHLGSYTTLEEAKRVRDEFLANAKAGKYPDPTRKRANESPYGEHISLDKRTNKYRVQLSKALTNDGKEKYLGYYTTLEEAKRVRDEFIADAKAGKYPEPTRKRANESPYGKHISLDKRTNKYRVLFSKLLTNDGKNKHLGYYTTLEEAKRVRDEFIANAKVGKRSDSNTEAEAEAESEDGDESEDEDEDESETKSEGEDKIEGENDMEVEGTVDEQRGEKRKRSRSDFDSDDDCDDDDSDDDSAPKETWGKVLFDNAHLLRDLESYISKSPMSTMKRQRLWGNDVPTSIVADTGVGSSSSAMQITNTHTPTPTASSSSASASASASFTPAASHIRNAKWMECYNCKIWKQICANTEGDYVFDCCGFKV